MENFSVFYIFNISVIHLFFTVPHTFSYLCMIGWWWCHLPNAHHLRGRSKGGGREWLFVAVQTSIQIPHLETKFKTTDVGCHLCLFQRCSPSDGECSSHACRCYFYQIWLLLRLHRRCFAFKNCFFLFWCFWGIFSSVGVVGSGRWGREWIKGLFSYR